MRRDTHDSECVATNNHTLTPPDLTLLCCDEYNMFLLSKRCDDQAGENKSVIFASKITMPLGRQQLLERSHLVERLRGGVGGKLTLISGLLGQQTVLVLTHRGIQLAPEVHTF